MTEGSSRGLSFTALRVTLELTSPLTIGSGHAHDFVDTPCVTDADGLPTIPGSSLAGVLRHLAAGQEDPHRAERCRKAFGFQEGNLGAASMIEVSFGQVHDASDRPVPMRAAATSKDEVLAFIAAGTTRDHVRLNGHGAADGDGKYDVHSVPAGARFTFELIVHAGSPIEAAEIVMLLTSPGSRLGGSTRRGLGAFSVVRAHALSFDLRKAGERDAWRRLPRGLHRPVPDGLLAPLAAAERATPGGIYSGSLNLSPEDLWLVGGGNPDDWPSLSKQGIDRVALVEKRVVWHGGKGKVGEFQALLPGSAVKGALRHRTAFHARRLRGAWALANSGAVEAMPAEVDDLFGTIKGRAAEDASVRTGLEEGKPGHVFIEDSWVEKPQTLELDHVSLDRFSGGPLDGHLFSEAPLFGAAVVVPFVLDLRERTISEGSAPGTDNLRTRALPALRAALHDLCRGRLALGSGSNKGHGYFRGQLTFDGDAPWQGEP